MAKYKTVQDLIKKNPDKYETKTGTCGTKIVVKKEKNNGK